MEVIELNQKTTVRRSEIITAHLVDLIRQEDLAVIQEFVAQHGHDIDEIVASQDADGNTPLHYASMLVAARCHPC